MQVQLLNSEGNVMFDSVESSQKNPLPPFGEDVPAFNAYSRSGVVEVMHDARSEVKIT